MCLGRNTESAVLYFIDQTYVNSKEKTIPSIIIDDKLYFCSHIEGLCKKASQRLSAFSRIVPY